MTLCVLSGSGGVWLESKITRFQFFRLPRFYCFIRAKKKKRKKEGREVYHTVTNSPENVTVYRHFRLCYHMPRPMQRCKIQWSWWHFRNRRKFRTRFKVAPSFWFLNINMPIFLLKPFPNCRRKTWFKFLGGSPSKCWPNSMPVFVCIAIGKSGFLKIKSQNGRWPQFFSPKVCSVKPVLAEELKKSGCLCSKYLTSLLRHVYVNRLVWT